MKKPLTVDESMKKDRTLVGLMARCDRLGEQGAVEEIEARCVYNMARWLGAACSLEPGSRRSVKAGPGVVVVLHGTAAWGRVKIEVDGVWWKSVGVSLKREGANEKKVIAKAHYWWVQWQNEMNEHQPAMKGLAPQYWWPDTMHNRWWLSQNVEKQREVMRAMAFTETPEVV